MVVAVVEVLAVAMSFVVWVMVRIAAAVMGCSAKVASQSRGAPLVPSKQRYMSITWTPCRAASDSSFSQ